MVNKTNLHAQKQIAAVVWNWLLNINAVQIITLVIPNTWLSENRR
jgi:hypothetical protein